MDFTTGAGVQTVSELIEGERRVVVLRTFSKIHGMAGLRLGYALAWLVTRLLSRSPIVHTDGPLSVAGAFTMAEARALAERAGLSGAQVGWRWPWRFLLSWRRPT